MSRIMPWIPPRRDVSSRRILDRVSARPTIHSLACEYRLYAGLSRWLTACGSWEHPGRPTTIASSTECPRCKEKA